MSINDAIHASIQRVLGELRKPENQDLKAHFIKYSGRSFDFEFATTENGMSNEEIKRFNSMMHEIDDGWTGFAYEYVCRRAQEILRYNP